MDIDRLHREYFKEERDFFKAEKCTVLYDIIGLAELNCFSVNKIHNSIAVLCNLPFRIVNLNIHYLKEICKERGLRFIEKGVGIFMIEETCFVFVREISSKYLYIMRHEDFCLNLEELSKDEEKLNYYTLNLISSCLI